MTIADIFGRGQRANGGRPRDPQPESMSFCRCRE